MSESKKRKTPASSSSKVYPIFAKKARPELDDTSNAAADATAPFDSKGASIAFQRFLDFSEVTNEEDSRKRLGQISESLIHNFRLVVRRGAEDRNVNVSEEGKEKKTTNNHEEETEFEVLEAEYYLLIGNGIHEDPFTHGSEEQKVSGRWYFHRAPKFSKDSTRSLTSGTEYRSGSRKGLDLTIGSPSAGFKSKYWDDEVATTSDKVTPQANNVNKLLCGGILLRTIREVKTRKIISGPSLLVDRILAASGATSIQNLVDNKWGGDINAFDLPDDQLESTSLDEVSDRPRRTCLYLKAIRGGTKNAPQIYYSPRIGLELSHPGTTSSTSSPLHPRIRFLPRRYRFFVHPELLTSNGRPQTFLGVLHSLTSYSTCPPDELEVNLKKRSLIKDISRLTGLKEVTAEKYLKDYILGREGGTLLLDDFIGVKGKGASSSPAMYLKMIGSSSLLTNE